MGLGHNYKFIKIKSIDVDNIVSKLKKETLNGINITIPFKTSFNHYLDDIDTLANYIGSINCIHSDNGILKGYNTDYYGFKSLISSYNIDLHKKEILVLGAGGASRAVCAYLADNNLQFSIFIRTNSGTFNFLYTSCNFSNS